MPRSFPEENSSRQACCNSDPWLKKAIRDQRRDELGSHGDRHGRSLFLTPFIVRHLGPIGYGVWILAVSTVSYLNLLDMGLRSSIVRYVSKNSAIENIIEAQKAIGAALWFRTGLAVVIGLLSIALAVAFPHLFKVPPDLQRAGQITVLLCALGVAITMISGVFGGVLSGINRFDVLSSISVGKPSRERPASC